MKIRLVCVGTRVPEWVRDGFETYARRLPRDNQLLLEEVARPRQDGDRARQTEEEGRRMLARLGAPEPGQRGNKRPEVVIALDEAGDSWRTAQLADRMRQWRQDGCDVALLVGGPDGLSKACRRRANAVWSLSALTLPHALVRVVVAEQVYRAWTVISGHPYHRS